MDAKTITQRFSGFATGNLSNAHPKVQAFGADIQPLYKGQKKLIGPAKTVKITPGQNAAIHKAVHTAQPGDVLVIDGGNTRNFGPFGDILTTCCQNQGILGLVISSTIRDSAEIEELGFPVYCLGQNPMVTAKDHPGEYDTDITCGDANISPGDLIFGDADGVVVIPKALIEDVADLTDAVVKKEEGLLQRLANGETTADIFGLVP